jgi:hypothetical protein
MIAGYRPLETGVTVVSNAGGCAGYGWLAQHQADGLLTGGSACLLTLGEGLNRRHDVPGLPRLFVLPVPPLCFPGRAAWVPRVSG